MITELLQPPLYILVCEVFGNVVHKKGTDRSTVVSEVTTVIEWLIIRRFFTLSDDKVTRWELTYSRTCFDI